MDDREERAVIERRQNAVRELLGKDNLFFDRAGHDQTVPIRLEIRLVRGSHQLDLSVTPPGKTHLHDSSARRELSCFREIASTNEVENCINLVGNMSSTRTVQSSAETRIEFFKSELRRLLEL